MNIADGMV